MGRYPYPPASVADRRVLSQKRQLLEGKQWNSLRQLIKEDQKKRAARDVKDDKLPHYITYGVRTVLSSCWPVYYIFLTKPFCEKKT